MTVKSVVTVGLALCGALMAGAVLADCLPAPVNGDLDFSVCKEWPAFPGLNINANAKFQRRSGPGAIDTSGTYDFTLSVLKSDQTEPVATYHQASAFFSDGVTLRDISLDTARYKLTPEVRAFGVRVQFTNASRLNPLEETHLSLFVKEGDKLRPVLSQLVVYEYGGEWDGDCTGERFEMTRTVEIAKTSSHGYADLIIKTRQTNTTNVVEGDTCEDKIHVSSPELTTLHYDGKSYVLPKGFKAIE
ncbi:hypothetical protein [Pseudomonas sp. BW7P1]|uniref:hypothetical protein n=1 Tax=Pseudomonas TaxID=286 RepID=UPI0021AD88E0|nr:hypothetical protein [Pseudomonas sp. BW7P1]UWI63221.1 hypothetical protein NWV16_07415 [Pseudomonas sp. BW7P1]